MSTKIIVGEGPTYEAARQEIQSKLPRGMVVICETKTIFRNRRKVTAEGSTFEIAAQRATAKLPEATHVAGPVILGPPIRETIQVRAFQETEALSAVTVSPPQRVESVAIVQLGRKGIFGVGRRGTLYDIVLARPATAEIEYVTPCRVEAEVGTVQEQAWRKAPGLIARLDEYTYDEMLPRYTTQMVRGAHGVLHESDLDPYDHYADASRSRWEAANALGKLGDLRAIPFLLSRIFTNPGVVAALEQLGYNRATEVESKGPSGLIDALVELGVARDDMVSDYVGLLKNRSSETRAGAARILGALEDRRAVQPLAEALDQWYFNSHCKTENLRDTLLESLVKLDQSYTIEHLMAQLNHESEGLRHHAVEALGRFDDPRVIESLKERLSDE